MHYEQHPLANKKVKIKEGTIDPVQNLVVEGAEYEIEDWWDRLSGDSWRAQNVWATVQYAARSVFNSLPLDDEVVYGKINSLGHLVHVSELEIDDE